MDQIIIFMGTLFINIRIRPAFSFSLIMKLNAFQIMRLHFLHSDDRITHKISSISGAVFRRHFHVKYNTLYFMSIKCVLCEAIGSANKTLHTDYQYAQNLYDLSFFYEKKETKKPDLCHLSKRGICSRGSFKKDKGQVVFFKTLR